MYKYCLTEDTKTLIRYAHNKTIQRFDCKKKEWVTDWDLSQIFFGGILVDMITEEEAKRIINNI